MEQGKNIFTIEYKSGMIRDFEKKIFAGGLCKAFLPMSFVSICDTDRVSYDCGGYQPMANLCFKNSRETLDLLEKCAFALLDGGEHLINPRKLELNTKTVFYSPIRKEVRLAYVPKQVWSVKIIHVVNELLEDVVRNIRDGETQNYLKSVMSYIEYSNGSLFDLINYFGELKREIHACG